MTLLSRCNLGPDPKLQWLKLRDLHHFHRV